VPTSRQIAAALRRNLPAEPTAFSGMKHVLWLILLRVIVADCFGSGRGQASSNILPLNPCSLCGLGAQAAHDAAVLTPRT
jgi:hypothetical protein